jgi:hypothetical protein
MKIIALMIGLLSLTSCSEWNKKFTDFQATPANHVTKTKKTNVKNKKAGAKEISGTLSNGTLYEAMQDPDGFIVNFDPFLPKDDVHFMKATSQIILKLYNDQIKDEARISIQTDIGYTIVEGSRARYKLVPYKEENGEISALSIVVI